MSTKLGKPASSILRLERILANRGVGSRNEVGNMIKQGRVRTLEGKIIRSASERYPDDTHFLVNGDLCEEVSIFLFFSSFFNEASGVVALVGGSQQAYGHALVKLFTSPKTHYLHYLNMPSTVGDPLQRRNLLEIYDSTPKNCFLHKMHPVGRLDADTSGLLLFSGSGDLTRRLLSPNSGIEREYEAIVTGRVDFPVLQQALAKGIETTLGTFPSQLTHAFAINSLSSIDDWLRLQYKLAMIDIPREIKTENTDISSLSFSYLRLSVTEGKYRMIRRILHNAGHSVVLLHRCRYGAVTLPNMTMIYNEETLITATQAHLWPVEKKIGEPDVKKEEQKLEIQKVSVESMQWAKKLLQEKEK